MLAARLAARPDTSWLQPAAPGVSAAGAPLNLTLRSGLAGVSQLVPGAPGVLSAGAFFAGWLVANGSYAGLLFSRGDLCPGRQWGAGGQGRQTAVLLSCARAPSAVGAAAAELDDAGRAGGPGAAPCFLLLSLALPEVCGVNLTVGAEAQPAADVGAPLAIARTDVLTDELWNAGVHSDAAFFFPAFGSLPLASQKPPSITPPPSAMCSESFSDDDKEAMMESMVGASGVVRGVEATATDWAPRPSALTARSRT